MTENIKAARPLSFTLIFAGLLFFFNPYFAVVDFLPDFIGCILILLGLDRFAAINRTMEEARAAVFKLLIFDLFKTVAIVMLMVITPAVERPVTLLILSFVGAILTLYFSYGAMRALFDGFYNLAATKGCDALWLNCQHKNIFLVFFDKCRAAIARRKGRDFTPTRVTERSRTELALRATLIFFAIREVVCALPEFSALSTAALFNEDLIPIYDYIGVMRFLAFVAVLIAAVTWLVKLIRYFRLVQKQTAFRIELGELYGEYRRTHPGSAVIRRYGIVFLLFAIGAFLLCDFYVDFKNIIPDYLGAVFLLLGVLLTDLERDKKLIGAGAALTLGVVSALSAHFTYGFTGYYSGAEISKTVEAASAYQTMWLFSLAEFLVFLAVLVGLLFLLRDVIRKWAGYEAVHKDEAFEIRRREAFLAEFDGELLRVFVFGFLSGLCSFLYDYIKEIPSKGVFRLLEFFWALDFSLALLFAIVLSFTLVNIHAQIRQRFLLED